MQAKKEISVAIIIGLIIGGIIIGGMYRAKTALDAHSRSLAPSATPTPSSTDSATNSALPLTIHTPLDNSVSDKSKVELTGTTQSQTYITILTETNEYIIVPDEIGNFSQEITLVKGANTVVVTVYTKTGEKVESTLNLVYTTAQL